MGCGGSKKTQGSEPAKQEEQPKPQEETVNKPKNTAEAIDAKFKEIDTDNTGYLTRDEIKQALKDLGEDGCNESQLDKFMDGVDKNDDGKISYSEFYKAWVAACKEEIKKEQILEAFKNMDKDGNGVLTKDEIRAALKECGAYEGKEQVETMITDADADGDGKVNYAEFVEVLDKESKK